MHALTRFTKSDIATYRAWFADPAVARHLTAPDDAWRAHIRQPTVHMLALRGPGLLAAAQLDIAPDGTGYCSLATNPACLRQGIGSRALALLLDYAKPQCHTLVGTVDPGNAPCLALLRRTGAPLDDTPDADGLLTVRWPLQPTSSTILPT